MSDKEIETEEKSIDLSRVFGGTVKFINSSSFCIERSENFNKSVLGMYRASDEDFARWAFGKDAWDKFMLFEISCIDLMKEWNLLHGDIFLCSESSDMKQDLQNMKKHYEENVKGVLDGRGSPLLP